MNERYLLDRFGQPPFGDPTAATTALITVWVSTLYGPPPARR